ncbi:hypothetical protein AU467_19720 [Mesorhizobium loti]|uniref:Uncharacterized protein n=1 Tax=Rhizobium loti TaxID=381 RepID=A0A101KTI8_RHILI|nr:hypothetical protein AU467_19720 [Mesorhizobium loti]
MTLPFVTRRQLLMGSAMVTATLPLEDHSSAAAASVLADTRSDPALTLWHEWQATYLRTAALCRKQQELETRLVEAIGFPKADVELPDEGITVTVSCQGDLEDLFGDDPDFAELRARAEADLAASQARWDAEDRRIGYSAAKREELATADREDGLLETLTATPATTIGGVAGKLDAVLREGESAEDCTEFPWPQLRAALVDLARIGQALQPGAFMPGSSQKQPYPRKRREDVCTSVIMYQRGDRVT